MKNTTKKVWSAFLAFCMLTGLLASVVYAEDGIVITNQPESVTAEKGETVTLTVEAEGENLCYHWYSNPYVDLENEELYSGAHTETLTIQSADCNLNETVFYCEISNNSEYAYTQDVFVTAPHGETDEWNYFYNEGTHIEFCVDCGKYHDEGEHVYGDDQICDTCGFNEADPIPSVPVFLEDPQPQNVNPGEDVFFDAYVYGIDVTYQWYKQSINDMSSEPILLTDSENVLGATTEQLILKNVTCDMTEHFYICVATNDAGVAERRASLYVHHNTSEWLPEDGYTHSGRCVCEFFTEEGYHEDEDCNGTCDICGYEFSNGAPMITVQPKSLINLPVDHEPATFTVSAEGENLTYQWYVEGEPLEDNERITGADTATLTIKSIHDPENDIYNCSSWMYNGFYCLISNDKGAVVSSFAIYDVEHMSISEFAYWDEYFHENYCVCGEWIEDTAHFDKDGDEKCDLCDAVMPELFGDLDPDSWYYNAAVYAKQTGLFIGEYGNFLPDDQITRGEMVTVLARVAFGGEQLDEMGDEEFEDFLASWNGDQNNTEFSDIEDYYYERYVRVLAALGIIKGYEDGSFQGQNSISREELAVLLVRFLDYIDGTNWFFDEPVEVFTDADQVSEWAKDEVELSRKMGLFRGDENANFMPLTHTTRAQVAQILYRGWFQEGMIG